MPNRYRSNKRRQKKRRFERSEVEFTGSKIIKNVDKNLKNRFGSINRPKETLGFTF